MNYKQNKLGPSDILQFNILQLTAEGYENFVCNWDGRVVSYDDDKATLNLHSRNEHEAKCRRQEAQSRPNKKDSDNASKEEKEENERAKEEKELHGKNGMLSVMLIGMKPNSQERRKGT